MVGSSQPWATFIAYVLLLNGLTYLVYWANKKRALTGAYRVSENSLLLLALLGGSFGALAACHYLRHKTRKQPFRA